MPKDTKQAMPKEETFSDDGSDEVHVVECSNFKVENLTIPAIDEKRSSDSQYHAFPSYKYGKKSDKLIVKTGPIKITKGGIPKLDDKWRKTDAKREFMWLGVDEEQPNCVELFNVFEQIDEHFDKLISYDGDEKVDNNLESKTVYIQKDKKKSEPLTVLEYAPIVRLSVQGGDGESKPDMPEYVPYKRCKLRFGKKYDKERKEGEPSELTTALFLGDNEDPEDLKYPSEFEKYLRWNCTSEFVLQFSKFRVKKAVEKDKKGKPIPRECAFDITLLQVIIVEEAPKSGMSNADKYRKRMFTSKPVLKQAETKSKKQESDVSSDESSEEEVEEKPVSKSKSKVESKVESKQTKKTQVESEDSDETESDSEDSSEEEEKPKPKAKSSKK